MEIADEAIEKGPEAWDTERLMGKLPMSNYDLIMAQEKDHILREVMAWLKVSVMLTKKAFQHNPKHIKYYRTIFSLLRMNKEGVAVFMDHHANKELLLVLYICPQKPRF